MIFKINLFIMTIFVFIQTLKTIKNRNIISIQMVISFGMYLYLFINPLVKRSPNIDNIMYNLLISVGIIGTIIACNSIPYNIFETNNYRTYRYRINKIWLNMATAFFIIYLLYDIITITVSYGSITAAFFRDRLESHLGDEYFSSNASMIIIEFMKLLFYFNVNRLYIKNKKIYATVLFILPMIHHQLTANTRFDFIAMLIVWIIFIYDERLWMKSELRINRKEDLENKECEVKSRWMKNKISTIRFMLLGMIIVPTSLVIMDFLNKVRNGFETYISYDLVFGINLIKRALPSGNSYFDCFYTLFSAYNNRAFSLEYGASWFLYPILNFIPRSIWHNKPITSFSPRFTQLLYWPLGQGLPVVTFTIFGEGFAQFGIIGVFLAPLFFVWSRYINIKVMRKIEWSKIPILMITMSLLTYMRGSVPVFQSILYMMYLFIIVNFLSCKKIYKGD